MSDLYMLNMSVCVCLSWVCVLSVCVFELCICALQLGVGTKKHVLIFLREREHKQRVKEKKKKQ